MDVCIEAEAWTKMLEQWFTNKEMPRARLMDACREKFKEKGPRRLIRPSGLPIRGTAVVKRQFVSKP